MKSRAITSESRRIYIAFGIFFTFVFIYFATVNNYVLYFQETQSLFIFSGDYLLGHLERPGGLLDYISGFLTQFYAGRLTGAVIVSVILILPVILLMSIHRKISQPGQIRYLLFLIPLFLMLLLQANYFYLLVHHTGFIVALLFFGFLTCNRNKHRNLLGPALFPVVYYIAGSFVLIYSGMFIVYLIFVEKARKRYLYVLLFIIAAVFTFLASWKFIFIQPVDSLLWFPFPVLETKWDSLTFIFLAIYLILFPVLSLNTRSVKGRVGKWGFYAPGLIVFVVVVFSLFKIYNPNTARIVELERRIFAGKFEEAVGYFEKHPTRNLIGLYFYNYALSEEGALCDRIFNVSQDFSYNSLILPWGDAHLDRGAYFYYSIGLMNEAHRWAYEEMVVHGQRPQNIMMLAKTSLLSGDYQMAKKYAGILKNTIFYRKPAKEIEKMAGDPDLIKVQSLLNSRSSLIPRDTFFIQFNEPQNNLLLILEANPLNRKAFEYYMAGLLLNKDVEVAVNNMKRMKELGYTRIPKHLEEAIWIYYDNKGLLPDLGGLPLSSESAANFRSYFSAFVKAKQNPAKLKETMEKSFGNTYWFYFHFK